MDSFGLGLQSSFWKKCSPTEYKYRIVTPTFRCEFLGFYFSLNILARVEQAEYVSGVKNKPKAGTWQSKEKLINPTES